MEIEEVAAYSNRVLLALNQLLPQLSQNFGELTQAELQAVIQSDASTLFMAHHEGEYLGTLTLVVFHAPSSVRAWIEDVVVNEQARGLGVGALLVQHAVDMATKKGARTIDLTSRSTRVPAITLYRKLGFVDRETSVFRHHGTDPDHQIS